MQKCESAKVLKSAMRKCLRKCDKRRNVIMRKCTLMLCALCHTSDEDISMTLITAEGVPLELGSGAGVKKLEWWGYWAEELFDDNTRKSQTMTMAAIDDGGR